jgi:predicted P-loop ATPase
MGNRRFNPIKLNKIMTYRKLLEDLDNLADEQLDEKVMAYIDDEMYIVTDVKVYEGDGQLTDGHPYLEIP